MKDRIPTKPHRVAVYDEQHQFLRYEYHERADEPTEQGTPLNKANLLSDATAKEFLLDANTGTPDKCLNILSKLPNIYVWAQMIEKFTTVSTFMPNQTDDNSDISQGDIPYYDVSFIICVDTHYSENLEYGESFEWVLADTASGSNKYITKIVNPQTFPSFNVLNSESLRNFEKVMAGKFLNLRNIDHGNKVKSTVYKMPQDLHVRGFNTGKGYSLLMLESGNAHGYEFGYKTQTFNKYVMSDRKDAHMHKENEFIYEGPQQVSGQLFFKLWENASPSSSMKEQKIYINTTQYKCLMITFSEYAASSGRNDGQLLIFLKDGTGEGKLNIDSNEDRHVEVRPDYVNFLAPHYSGHMIPLAIYGITI